MRRTTIAALIVGLSCPLSFGIGLALSVFMPNCEWAASAPAGGCFLFGINLNWLITVSTVAFVGSFFSIPLGLLIAFIGGLVCNDKSASGNARQ